MSDASMSGSLPLPDASQAFQAYVKSCPHERVGEQVELTVMEVLQVNIDITLGIITFEFGGGKKRHYPFELYEQIWLRRGDAPTVDGH